MHHSRKKSKLCTQKAMSKEVWYTIQHDLKMMNLLC